jgi:hypothetical protein
MPERSTENENKMHPSDFYYDYERSHDRRKSRIINIENKMLRDKSRVLLELRGRYAILETNGGHITSSGKVLPEFIKNEDDLALYLRQMEMSYNEGVTEGISAVKRRFEGLFDTP